MSYEVFCRGEHAYYVPLVATKEDGRRQPEIELEKLKKEIGLRGFTFKEADTQILLTCYATCEEGFESTAEWSRIQERLKRADELEAELERVADQLSDTWLYLDAWARSESVTIEDVKALCETLLRKQQVPGWKPVVKDSFTTRKEGE